MIINRKFFKDLFIALRVLSLSLALTSTSLGMAFAHRAGFLDLSRQDHRLYALLVILGGLLAQSGTNLVNDFFEGSFKYHRPGEKRTIFLGLERSAFDWLVFAWSLSCFGLAALIGFYLMWAVDPRIFFFGLAGLIGGYAYTGEPIVYKKRGLGAPLSFLLMGPLMVLGSYFVFSQEMNLSILLTSLPSTLFIPLLMLSNEMRDYQRDRTLGVKTAVVRLGFPAGKKLFGGLLFTSYSLCLLLVLIGSLPMGVLWTLVTFPLAIAAYQRAIQSKKEGIPATNVLTIAFQTLFLFGLLFSKGSIPL